MARSAADYEAELQHVPRDLRRIGIIAVFLFGIIFAAPYLIK